MDLEAAIEDRLRLVRDDRRKMLEAIAMYIRSIRGFADEIDVSSIVLELRLVGERKWKGVVGNVLERM